MDKVSEALFALRPVTFRYEKEIDPEGIPQFGLVAEEVEKVNPDLVIRDPEGKPYSVRYEAVNAMLLQRVSQRASQSAGNRGSCVAAREVNGHTDCGAERTRSANSESQ
jgi:hypothetical protein